MIKCLASGGRPAGGGGAPPPVTVAFAAPLPTDFQHHGRIGTRVLLEFSDYLVKIHSDSSSLGIGADLLDKFESIFQGGIGSVSVSSYNSFQNELSAIRKVLPDDCKIPDPLLT